MSIQHYLNDSSMESFLELEKEFIELNHPHPRHTILRHMCNYHTPVDNMDHLELCDFMESLRNELEHLVLENKNAN